MVDGKASVCLGGRVEEEGREYRTTHSRRIIRYRTPGEDTVRICQSRLPALCCDVGGAFGVVVEARNDVARWRVFEILGFFLVDGFFLRKLLFCS